MKDIERILTEALRAEGESFDPDTYAARQRFLERRRKKRIGFAVSGLALAGAAVAAVVFVASSVPSPGQDDEIDLASATPKVIATAPVSGAPEAAAVVSDGVWIANAEPGRVVKVDPATNEVVASVPLEGSVGTPDEIVAVGSSLAVTTTDGFIHILDAGSAAASDYETKQGTGPISMDIDGPTPAARASDTFRLDLDVSGDTVWVANENDGFIYGIYNAGTGGKDFTGEPVEDIAPNDIAVGDGRVFGLDGDRGQVAVFEITGEPGPPKLERTGTFEAPSGDFLDMRFGFGKLWISDESGTVTAFDPDTGEELSVADIGGRYTDLVIDENSVWALPGGTESGGRLVAIDPEDGAVRNEGIAIDGNPVDVVVGLGSLWVVDKDGAEEDGSSALLRVDPTGVGTPAPDPEATESEEPVVDSSAEPFFAYSADGEIYLELTDGTTKQITMSQDAELNPVFAFGSLIFERHDYETDNYGLITHDLATGDEQGIELDGEWKGTHPAVSAGGDLAWAEASDEGSSVHVWPGFSTGKPETESFEVPLPEGLADPRNLIFSDDAERLYYQALGEGWVTVQVPLSTRGESLGGALNGVANQPPGSTFVQPEDPDVTVTVLDVCCREIEGDPYSQFTIGQIELQGDSASYQRITEAVDLANADPGALSMISLHGAALNADGSWDLFADPDGSWLVTDGTSIWLLTEKNGGQVAPETLELAPELAGFSVNPYLEGND